MVDGVHFRLDHPRVRPADVGHRALAAALSDLAAMGADAGEAYVALGVPTGLGADDVVEVARGHGGAGGAHRDDGRRRRPRPRARADPRRHRRRLGRRPRRARRPRRRAARATSSRSRARSARRRPGWPMLEGRATRARRARARAHLRPEPRLAEGRALARGGRARAHRPLRRAGHRRRAPRPTAAGCGSTSTSTRCPLAPGVAEVAAQLGVPAWELAAAGGEDFELCACLPADGGRRPRARPWSAASPRAPRRLGLRAGGAPVRAAGFEHRLG